MFSLWRGVIEIPDTMADIIERVSLETGIPIAELKSPGRRRPITYARQDFMARARATGRFSFAQIGRFLGRDHTTIVHGVRAHARRAAA